VSEDLGALRESIDRIDTEMLRLLNQRAEVAQKIGHLKSGVAYKPEREAEVLRRVKEKNPGPLPDDAAAFLFREIMSACLALEKPVRVAHLGPTGTFSEAAAIKHFGHGAEVVPCASIDEVFRSAESGAAGFAVVPVENSTEGAIGKTLDLMLQTPLNVCGEVMLRIHHHLLARATGVDFKSIQRVYSHPQSLGQCHQWLAANLPHVERVPASSNAEAARLAGLEANAAAIAGEAAAGRFGLERLAQNIEDEPSNTTRFLVLGNMQVDATGRDKTSFAMSAKNQPGAIHELLAPLAAHKVSMTKLESRPSRMANWEYFFFVDSEGHRRDPDVANALREIESRALHLKIMGSYPVAAF
jgi:chorismate mutase / prephenate dehydratase